MLKTLALALAFAASTAAAASAHDSNPPPNPPADLWAGDQIKTPENSADCDFCQFGTNAVSVDGALARRPCHRG